MARAGLVTGVVAVLLGGAAVLGWTALAGSSKPAADIFDAVPATFGSDEPSGIQPSEMDPSDGFCGVNSPPTDPDC